MKNVVKIYPHVLVWGIILLVPIFIMMKEEILASGAYLSSVLRSGILALLFYINYLYLIDKFLFRKKFVIYILINFCVIAFLIYFQNTIQDLLRASDFHHLNNNVKNSNPPGPPIEIIVFSNYLLNIFVLGSSIALKMTVRWHKDSIVNEQAKNGQLEADLRNLRSQLNPHFLFNTLNNIYSLIAIDQNKAQDSVHRLSNLLRYVLYDNNSKFVSIDKELEFTQNYIDLMKLRIGSGIKLNVIIENNGSNGTIASLMFMTLIENAFKHGSSNGNDGFIDIKILVDKNNGVLCSVENSVSTTNKQMESGNSGIGLKNLTQRLQLLYPNKYSFETEQRPDSFFALLKIDF